MKLSDLNLPAETMALIKHLVEGKEDLELPEPKGYQVMALQYVRPDKTASGLYLSNKTTDEDKWQGRTGLVLALGGLAYSDKSETACKPLDWILWGKLENSATRTAFGRQSDKELASLVFINDDRILATVSDPMTVIGK